jgi:hypothetical protein
LLTPTDFNQRLTQDFLPALSERQRQLVQEASGLLNYLTMGESFANSVADLRHLIGLSALPDPRRTFQRNLDYIIRYNAARQGWQQGDCHRPQEA